MIPKRKAWTQVTLALLVILTTWLANVANAPRAWAHGNAMIKVTSGPLVFGGSITIEGENFEKEDEVTLTLVGLTEQLPLGIIRADGEGNFRFEGSLPLTAHPGRYQVRARGRDTTALADTRIVASLDSAAVQQHTTGIGFHRGGSPGATAALAVVIAVLAVGGFALAFLPRFRSTSSNGG